MLRPANKMSCEVSVKFSIVCEQLEQRKVITTPLCAHGRIYNTILIKVDLLYNGLFVYRTKECRYKVNYNYTIEKVIH